MRAALIAACCVLAAACVTAPLAPPPVAVYQSTASAETAFAVASTLFAKYRTTLAPATVVKIAGLLKSASAALDAAEDAEALGDATTTATQISAALALVAQVKGLLP